MEFREKVEEICRKAEVPIEVVVNKGAQGKVVRELDDIKKEFLEALENIPLSFIQTQYYTTSNEQAISCAAYIEQTRKIVELCVAIIDELKTNPLPSKVRALMFAWQNRYAATE